MRCGGGDAPPGHGIQASDEATHGAAVASNPRVRGRRRGAKYCMNKSTNRPQELLQELGKVHQDCICSGLWFIIPGGSSQQVC
nr:uncharacterized protein LOC127307228 isoform X2 [Lolium perenne]